MTKRVQVLSDKHVGKLLTLMNDFSYKWEDIGLALGFTFPELKVISGNPLLLNDAPTSYLTELLGQWVQWPTAKHHTDPTLATLYEALRGPLVGLGQLAEKVKREFKMKDGHGGAATVSPQTSSDSLRNDINSQPTLAELSLLQTPRGKVKIIKKMSVDWRGLGALMNFDSDGTQIDIIGKKHPNDPKECCRALFQHWLNGNGVKPCSWRKLIELIRDCDDGALAQEIQSAFSA